MDNPYYMGIPIKKKEYKKQQSEVKTYFLTDEELQKYRELAITTEQIDAGGLILARLKMQARERNKRNKEVKQNDLS